MGKRSSKPMMSADFSSSSSSSKRKSKNLYQQSDLTRVYQTGRVDQLENEAIKLREIATRRKIKIKREREERDQTLQELQEEIGKLKNANIELSQEVDRLSTGGAKNNKVSMVSQKWVHEFSEKHWMNNPKVNAWYVPDALEGPAREKALFELLTFLCSAIESTQLDIFDHRITFNMFPIPKSEEKTDNSENSS